MRVRQLGVSGSLLRLSWDASIRANTPGVLEIACCIDP